MTTPSKVTPPRRTRKTKSEPIDTNVVAYIVFKSPEYRKQRASYEWQAVFKAYVSTLTEYEADLVKTCLAFIGANPVKRDNPQEPCPIIPFPVGGKRGVQVAKEA